MSCSIHVCVCGGKPLHKMCILCVYDIIVIHYSVKCWMKPMHLVWCFVLFYSMYFRDCCCDSRTFNLNTIVLHFLMTIIIDVWCMCIQHNGDVFTAKVKSTFITVFNFIVNLSAFKLITVKYVSHDNIVRTN